MIQLIYQEQGGNLQWENWIEVVTNQDELSGFIWLKLVFVEIYNGLCNITMLSFVLSLYAPQNQDPSPSWEGPFYIPSSSLSSYVYLAECQRILVT